MRIHHIGTHSCTRQSVARHTLNLFCSLLVLFNISHTLCAPVDPSLTDGSGVKTTSVDTSADSSQDVDATGLVTTSLGKIAPLDVGSNVNRFTVPFAQPPLGNLRFANPQTIQNVSNYDTTKTPPSCFQNAGDPRGGNSPSEDCLYATYYYPKNATQNTVPLPIMVWVHGGSGIGGSSTASGLDGTNWASSQNVIVVLLQYRLGLFGWLQTSKVLDESSGGTPGGATVSGNQAMRDVVMALQQVRDLVGSIGGDPNKVTLMGQSSGASMVRALLSTPAAQPLFHNAIIVSDPEDYGPSSIADNNVLGEYGMQQLNCSISDLACARAADPQDVYDASLYAYSDIPPTDDRISGGTPWRSMIGQYIPSTVDLSPQEAAGKDVIMTTVANEAATAVGYYFAPSKPNDTTLMYNEGGTATLGEAADIFFNEGRGDAAAGDQAAYPPPSNSSVDGLRAELEKLATDGLWRCGTQRNAINLAAAGTHVWLAQWQVAAKYPSNAAITMCTENGNVCHEDDIYVIFGTAPASQANAAVTALSQDIQTRYANFARIGVPSGASGSTTWPKLSSASSLNLLLLGRRGSITAAGAQTKIAQTQRAQACQHLWGSTVQFDSQHYPS